MITLDVFRRLKNRGELISKAESLWCDIDHSGVTAARTYLRKQLGITEGVVTYIYEQSAKMKEATANRKQKKLMMTKKSFTLLSKDKKSELINDVVPLFVEQMKKGNFGYSMCAEVSLITGFTVACVDHIMVTHTNLYNAKLDNNFILKVFIWLKQNMLYFTFF